MRQIKLNSQYGCTKPKSTSWIINCEDQWYKSSVHTNSKFETLCIQCWSHEYSLLRMLLQYDESSSDQSHRTKHCHYEVFFCVRVRWTLLWHCCKMLPVSDWSLFFAILVHCLLIAISLLQQFFNYVLHRHGLCLRTKSLNRVALMIDNPLSKIPENIGRPITKGKLRF
jgi:hypothetical protein